MRIDSRYYLAFILPLLAACGADQPAASETETSSTTNMSAEESSTQVGTETETEAGTETETGEPPVNVCDTCTENELCVARADDACDEDFGYTLECVPEVDSCEGDACDPDCLSEVCGNDTCPPPCGDVPGVDVWCSGEAMGGDCSPTAQDCPEGEKCVAYGQFGGQTSWDSNKCVPVTGDNMIGEACMSDGVAAGTDDCDGTSMCFGYDEDLMGSCYGFCGPGESCPDGQECLIANQTTIALCIDECVPHHPDNCGPEIPCLEMHDVYACVPLPFPTLPPDSECTMFDYCSQGQACVPADELDGCGGDGCCTDWCDTAEPDVCNPPLSCQPYFEQGQAPAGLETAGVCKLG